MKLSILIPTLVTRRAFYQRLHQHLSAQIASMGTHDVEIVVLEDNREKSIGEKRNILLSRAAGDFLVFIDDDDRVSDDYVKQVLEAIHKNPDADCIVYDCICTIDAHKPTGGREFYCKYGIEYEYTKLEPWGPHNSYKRPVREEWFGKPAHTMVYRSEIAKQCSFPHKNTGEDFDWVSQVWPKVRKQVRIEQVLYYYDVVLGKKY
jgi:glycosyltransferase involved in cell wall biosynthesis